MEKNIEISLDEMKKLEIKIMSFVDKICKENNLKYSLMDGSLIGAVRHHGFIPWDDDIDIMMPRPDYEKLKQIFKNINKTDKDYYFIDDEIQDDYYHSFGKIVYTKTIAKEKNLKSIKNYGINIDIFPVDAVYSNKIKRFFQTKKIFLLKYFTGYYSVENKTYNSFVKRIYKPILNYIINKVDLNKLMKSLQKNMKKCDYNSSEYVALLGTVLGTKKGVYFPKNFFEEYEDTKFEDCEFSIIKKYDPYLKKVFGNYMQLPPEEDRVPHHGFDYLKYKKN